LKVPAEHVFLLFEPPGLSASLLLSAVVTVALLFMFGMMRF